ncbi:MAG: peroxide stress protein YaaA, partial [Psychroflexus sp.]|nr:peroxide stress protein YaaA [Psychroflexus sp.]
ILISPAKSLDLETDYDKRYNSKQQFAEKANHLNNILAEMSKEEISKLMHISDKLTALNYDRYQDKKSGETDADRAAIFMFDGDVYNGLDIESINKDEYEDLQDKLRILSGMYGMLRPFDVISPYRLEMGTKLQVDDAQNLYEFWKDELTSALAQEMTENELLVNLASQEYFKAIDQKEFKSRLISPVFKDLKNGKLKIISFYAKKARGQMVNFIIKNKCESLEDLKAFDRDDYKFSATETQKETEPVFIR